jgi:transcriptional regulator with XRE-family HTH domain
MDIGGKIRSLRVMNGLTQEELANRTELSKGFISQLEHNLTSPSIETLMDILQCLGTTAAEFFNDDSDGQIVFRSADYFEKERQRPAQYGPLDHPERTEKHDGTDTSGPRGRRLHLPGQPARGRGSSAMC